MLGSEHSFTLTDSSGQVVAGDTWPAPPGEPGHRGEAAGRDGREGSSTLILALTLNTWNSLKETVQEILLIICV